MEANVKKHGSLQSTGMLALIALRNIRRNGRRTVLCVVAVGIAVFFTIVMQAMMAGMISAIEQVVRVFETGTVSAVSGDFEAEKEYFPVQYPVGEGRSLSELKVTLGEIPGVKAVVGRITAFATLQDSTIKHALLWGIDAAEETALNDFNQTDKTNGLVEGRFPSPGANECAIGVRMAKKAGLRIGDRVPLKTVSSQFSDKLWSPAITGIFEFDYMKYDEDVVIVDLGRLQRLLGLGGAVQQVLVFAERPDQSRAISNAVREILPEDVVREWRDNYYVAMMQQSQVIYVVAYLVFLIVASFLIINTVVMIIHERIKEIGMMGSLGMTRREIVEVFFFEALFLSILGALAGAAVGAITTGIGSIFPLDFNAMTGGGFKEFPIAGTLYLQFSPAILVQGFLFGVVIAGICTLFPSLKSAFIEPVEALRR